MNCYITYDYELCLGSKTGSPKGCLIEPMNALCSMFEKYGVKTNVFVDAAYLLRLKELKDENSTLGKDYNMVINHIVELSRKGHSIQLHYHPQWINAQYVNGNWILDNDHYKLSDYPLDLQKEKLMQAVELLQSLSRNKIVAFRAGGFSIENFQDIALLLSNMGIRIDTSVLRGGYVNSKYQSYDYRDIPLSTSYPFSTNNKTIDCEGLFTEYPISVMDLDSLSYIYYKKVKRKKREKKFQRYPSQRWNDGLGIGTMTCLSSRIKNIIRRFFSKNPLYASADGSLVYFLDDVLNYSKRKYKGDEFVIIGHPKIATPRTVAALEEFITNHQSEIQYKTFS